MENHFIIAWKWANQGKESVEHISLRFQVQKTQIQIPIKYWQMKDFTLLNILKKTLHLP